MLDAIRQHAQSWGIKIAFSLIILVFVFWGVGNFKGGRAGVLAVIDDHPLQINDFLRAYEREVDDVRRRNPDIRAEDLRQLGFKRQVFERLVSTELLTAEAKRLGVTVTPQEMQQEIARMPAFRNEAGKFDPATYERTLRAAGTSPRDFEAGFERDLALSKVRALVTAAASVSEAEARSVWEFSRERMVASYALFERGPREAAIQPTTEELAQAFEKHKASFTELASMTMEFALITPEALAPAMQVTDEEVASEYLANKATFKREERVKARQILLKVAKDAPEAEARKAKDKLLGLKTRAQKGEKFEDLAKQFSESPEKDQGGDLGWFGREVMVKEFEDAAFAQPLSQIGEPVRTEFGWHLIKVEAREAAGQRTLDEVKGEIRQALAEDKAAAKLATVADQAMELVAADSDLNKLKTVPLLAGLTIKKSAPFSKPVGPAEMQLDPKQVETLFALKKNEATISPLTVDEGYLFARKIDETPERVPPLDEIKDRVAALVKVEKATAAAKAEAEAMLAAIAAAKTPAEKDAAAAKLAGAGLKQTEPFGRQGAVPGLGQNPELIADAFAAPAGEWLAKAYPVPSGFAVVKTGARTPPPAENWAKEKAAFSHGLEQARKEELFQAFLQGLRKKAKIELVEPRALEE